MNVGIDARVRSQRRISASVDPDARMCVVVELNSKARTCNTMSQ